jgi:hypothetical protein
MHVHYGLLAVVGAFALTQSMQVRADTTTMKSVIPSSEECPNVVRGVAMSLTNVREGVQLDFTAASKQQRGELEYLLREASAILEYYSKMAALEHSTLEARDGSALPAVDIHVRTTERGARVTVNVDEHKDLPALLVQAKSFKKFWDTSPCIQNADVQAPPPAWTQRT